MLLFRWGMNENIKNPIEDNNPIKNLNVILKRDEGSHIGYYLTFISIIVLILAYVIVKAFNLFPDSAYGTWTDSFSILAALIFFIASIWGVNRSANLKIRDGIVLFALCSTCLLLYELSWAYYNIIDHNMMPYPSFGDVFYVAAHVLMILAIIMVTRGLRTKPKLDVSMIILMLVASVIVSSVIMLITGLSPGDIYGRGHVNMTMVLNLGYPILDVIALVMVGRLLEVSQGRSIFEAQVMLAIAICLISFADIYFSIISTLGLYDIGSLPDQLFIIAYVLFGLSVWRYVNLTRRDIVKDIANRTKIGDQVSK